MSFEPSKSFSTSCTWLASCSWSSWALAAYKAGSAYPRLTVRHAEHREVPGSGGGSPGRDRGKATHSGLVVFVVQSLGGETAAREGVISLLGRLIRLSLLGPRSSNDEQS